MDHETVSDILWNALSLSLLDFDTTTEIRFVLICIFGFPLYFLFKVADALHFLWLSPLSLRQCAILIKSFKAAIEEPHF